MQKINSTRSFLALSAASLALLPLVGAVQAKPKDDAPAYGYRNKNKKNKGNGNGRGRNRNRGENFGRVVSLEGVVTSNNGGGDFQVRAGGQTFDVNSDSNVSVRQGDRVVLRGAFDGDNNFNAQNVRVIGRNGGNYGNGSYGNGGNYGDYGNGGNYGGDNDDYGNGGYDNDGGYSDNGGIFQNGQRVNFTATFVRYVKVGQYEVRDDSGRTFRVDAREGLRFRRKGERVQVTGIFRDGRITEARLSAPDDSTNNGDYGNGTDGGNGGTNGTERTVDFPARILSLNSRDKSGVVRGDNGRTYRVVGSELKGFSRGDRVRVRGIARNGRIDLRDLDKI